MHLVFPYFQHCDGAAANQYGSPESGQLTVAVVPTQYKGMEVAGFSTQLRRRRTMVAGLTVYVIAARILIHAALAFVA